RLSDELAPDVAAAIVELAREVPAETFSQLAPLAPPTGVIALARRPAERDAAAVLEDGRAAPAILLENPRDLGHVRACGRGAAAADAAGVLVLGGHDPWHPDALRGAAGLHFALPVVQVEDSVPRSPGRPLVALDPAGEALRPGVLPSRALLAFGTERQGL